MLPPALGLASLHFCSGLTPEFILSVVCPSQVYSYFTLHFQPLEGQDRSAPCYVFRHNLLIIHILPACTSASTIRAVFPIPVPTLFSWVVTSLFLFLLRCRIICQKVSGDLTRFASPSLFSYFQTLQDKACFPIFLNFNSKSILCCFEPYSNNHDR